MKKGTIILVVITALFFLIMLGIFIGRATTDGQIKIHARSSTRSDIIDEAADKTFKKININTASIEELQEIPGIGEETAKEIINHRKKHGKFKIKKDIMDVKGIGEKTYEEIKDLITVSGEE